MASFKSMVSKQFSVRESWGVLPYISIIGMCRPKGYDFGAALV